MTKITKRTGQRGSAQWTIEVESVDETRKTGRKDEKNEFFANQRFTQEERRNPINRPNPNLSMDAC